MTSHSLAISSGVRSHGLARVADFVALTKPRIAVLELVTVAAAAFWAARGPAEPLVMLATLLGTALVAASASAFNQWWETRSDMHMARTCDRPLPRGRIGRGEAWWFGVSTGLAGTLMLVLAVNVTTAAVALATWFTYVVIYTPLKRVSPANTFVGAIAGALPVLIGWTSVGAPLDIDAATLFVVLFLWQFPHFMAIAWIYRRQYRAAGFRMLTVVDGTGRRAGAQAVVAALALVPVSLIPGVRLIEPVYFAGALALGLWQLTAAMAFLVRRDPVSARRLLTVTLIYLPALLILLTLTPLI